MRLYQSQDRAITSQQDKAKLSLLKYSESFEDTQPFTWEENQRKPSSKVKSKVYGSSSIKIEKPTILFNSTQQLQRKNITKRILEDVPLKKQGLIGHYRRYDTQCEQLQKGKIIPQHEYSLINLCHLKATKQNDEKSQPHPQTLFLSQPQPPISRTRSKTVFIHMLKNKSASMLHKNMTNSQSIIHNLSSIKVRIMSRKIEESKVMNYTNKDLKDKLEKLTTTKSIHPKKQKIYFKLKKFSVYEILSKRHKIRQLTQNLRNVS